MAMQAETLDILEQAQLPPGQARAIARVIDLEIAASRETLATRSELGSTFESFRKELHWLRQALESKIEAKCEALKSEILKNLYGAMFAQFAMLLGLAYFFLNALG